MAGLIFARSFPGATASIFRTMAKSMALAKVCIFFCYFSYAQSYPGYHSSSYTGVYGILTNPADILNHRFRADFNIVGFFTQLNNNLVSFKYHQSDGDNITRPDHFSKMGKLNFNTDVFGPSFLLRLSDKHALALTTRARVMANINGVGINLLNLAIPETLDPSLVKADLSINNTSIRVHGWTEFALTYSRQVGITDYGVWKAGISLKYLSGVGAFSLNTNKLAFSYNDSLYDPVDNKSKPALTNLQGTIAIGYTKNLDSLGANLSDYISFTNPGIGMDIGVNYEYRDEMQVYETAYSDKTRNYIWRIGASITDIGFIRYSKNQALAVTAKFSGNTYFTDNLKPPSDSTSIQQMVNYYQTILPTRTEPSAITMQLPTALHLTYDRFFNIWLGVQAQVNVPLIFSTLDQYMGTHNPVSVCITPRAEISWCGLYLPVSYNSISGFQAGASIRLGPLVIGSGSLINTRLLNKTRGVDAYLILRVPFFGYREFKEKIKSKRIHLSKSERKALSCPAN